MLIYKVSSSLFFIIGLFAKEEKNNAAYKFRPMRMEGMFP